MGIDELTQKTLLAFAQKIRKLKLNTAVIFFLEINRPLWFLVEDTFAFWEPFLRIFFNKEESCRIAHFLKSRENLNYLINVLENKNDGN